MKVSEELVEAINLERELKEWVREIVKEQMQKEMLRLERLLGVR